MNISLLKYNIIDSAYIEVSNHVEYVFILQDQYQKQIVIMDRYKNIRTLYNSLKRKYPNEFLNIEFPPKTIFSSTSRKFLESRKARLSNFLNFVLVNKEIIKDELLLKYLKKRKIKLFYQSSQEEVSNATIIVNNLNDLKSKNNMKSIDQQNFIQILKNQLAQKKFEKIRVPLTEEEKIILEPNQNEKLPPEAQNIVSQFSNKIFDTTISELVLEGELIEEHSKSIKTFLNNGNSF